MSENTFLEKFVITEIDFPDTGFVLCMTDVDTEGVSFTIDRFENVAGARIAQGKIFNSNQSEITFNAGTMQLSSPKQFSLYSQIMDKLWVRARTIHMDFMLNEHQTYTDIMSRKESISYSLTRTVTIQP